MSKSDPTKAERIAAAKARALREAEKRKSTPPPPPHRVPGDKPLPWLEGDAE